MKRTINAVWSFRGATEGGEPGIHNLRPRAMDSRPAPEAVTGPSRRPDSLAAPRNDTACDWKFKNVGLAPPPGDRAIPWCGDICRRCCVHRRNNQAQAPHKTPSVSRARDPTIAEVTRRGDKRRSAKPAFGAHLSFDGRQFAAIGFRRE